MKWSTEDFGTVKVKPVQIIFDLIMGLVIHKPIVS